MDSSIMSLQISFVNSQKAISSGSDIEKTYFNRTGIWTDYQWGKVIARVLICHCFFCRLWTEQEETILEGSSSSTELSYLGDRHGFKERNNKTLLAQDSMGGTSVLPLSHVLLKQYFWSMSAEQYFNSKRTAILHLLKCQFDSWSSVWYQTLFGNHLFGRRWAWLCRSIVSGIN